MSLGGAANFNTTLASVDEAEDSGLWFTKTIDYFGTFANVAGILLNVLCLLKLARLKSPHNRAVLQGIAWANLVSLLLVLFIEAAR